MVMRKMKRLLALLLCLSLLLPVFALAEDDEEDMDFNELIEEDVDLDEDGNIIHVTALWILCVTERPLTWS